MNCPNCAAPMQLVDRRDYFTCPYCTTFHFPAETSASDDRVRVLGGAADTSCPVCRTALSSATIQGQRVAYCQTCRGILASNGAFRQIAAARRSKHVGPATPPTPLDPAEYERELACPGCGSRMDVHPYYGPGNVVVDTCGACFLIWLDHGELSVIERAPGGR